MFELGMQDALYTAVVSVQGVLRANFLAILNINMVHC